MRTAARERGAGARQTHNVLSCRSAPGRALCSARLRAPGFRDRQHPAEEPRREGTSLSGVPGVPRALSPRRNLPKASGPGKGVPGLWGGQVGPERQAEAQASLRGVLTWHKTFPVPETGRAEFLLVFL